MLALIWYHLWPQQNLLFSCVCMFQLATQTSCVMKTLFVFAVSYMDLTFGYMYLNFLDLRRPYTVKNIFWMLPLYKVLNVVPYLSAAQWIFPASSQRQTNGILVWLPISILITHISGRCRNKNFCIWYLNCNSHHPCTTFITTRQGLDQF